MLAMYSSSSMISIFFFVIVIKLYDTLNYEMLEEMWILSRIIPMTYSDSLVCLGSPIRATHVSMQFVIQGMTNGFLLLFFAEKRSATDSFFFTSSTFDRSALISSEIINVLPLPSPGLSTHIRP